MNPLNSVNGTIIAGVVLAILIGLVTMGGPQFNVNTFLVWIHVLAGIVWIGMLYYFNFVQVPALADAAADQGGPGGAAIGKYVAPRALAWFRWGAVVTWVSGAAYLGHLGLFVDAFTLGLTGGGAPALIIGVGAWLGTIMLINVWALIWPNQKKILGMVEAGADEIAKARRVALLASRTNTLLSIPMIMSMVGFGHGGFII